MTREERETLILAKLAEIRKIAAEYMERDCDYLTAYITHSDGKVTLSCNNKYWEGSTDEDKPIDTWRKS